MKKVKTEAALGQPIGRKAHLEVQLRKSETKLDRIKKWPNEHRRVSTERTEKKINQIREELNAL